MSRAPLPLLFTSLLAGACFTIDFDVDVEVTPEDPMRIELGRLGTECNDPATRIDHDRGWTEYSTMRDGDLCRIVAHGEMRLLDMAEVKELVDEKIVENGEDPDEIGVALQEITIRFEHAHVLDANDDEIAPPRIASWSADLRLDGAPFAELGAEDTTTLLDASRSFSLTPDQVKRIDQALESAAPVRVEFDFDLAVSIADIPTLSESEIGFFITALIRAEGTKDLI